MTGGMAEIVLRWRHVPSRVFKPFVGLEDNLQKCPNELIIGLGRGRNLPIMDRSLFSKGGSSDPGSWSGSKAWTNLLLVQQRRNR